ncbi:hypothetical protein MKW94_014689, partial [Papaver nudicaule]|nr:hypothetical protein [Papaver nudicaule]
DDSNGDEDIDADEEDEEDLDEEVDEEDFGGSEVSDTGIAVPKQKKTKAEVQVKQEKIFIDLENEVEEKTIADEIKLKQEKIFIDLEDEVEEKRITAESLMETVTAKKRSTRNIVGESAQQAPGDGSGEGITAFSQMNKRLKAICSDLPGNADASEFKSDALFVEEMKLDVADGRKLVTNNEVEEVVKITETLTREPKPRCVTGSNFLPKPDYKQDLPGFIFMCSGETKLECFKYRIFGLPAEKMYTVANIKPGAKLFLFDVDLRLLYGVFKATSEGELDLEPAAFGGRFPAQVRFSIFKECIPVHESFFRHTIKENCLGGTKFQQQLSNCQVENLFALFRPISGSPESVLLARPHYCPPVKFSPEFQPSSF